MPKNQPDLTNALNLLMAQNDKSLKPEPLLDGTKFVQCDVCERIITGPLFRAMKSKMDVCNVCKYVISTARTRSLTSSSGALMRFMGEKFFCMGKAPCDADVLAQLHISPATTLSEFYPDPSAAADRLKHQAVVKKSAAKTSGRSKRTVAVKRPRSKEEEEDDDEGTVGDAIRVTQEVTTASPKQQEEVRPPPIAGKVTRKVSEALAQPPSVIAPQISATSTKRAIYDEDDMPFFLSSSSLSAVEEAQEHPIAIVAPPAEETVVVPPRAVSKTKTKPNPREKKAASNDEVKSDDVVRRVASVVVAPPPVPPPAVAATTTVTTATSSHAINSSDVDIVKAICSSPVAALFNQIHSKTHHKESRADMSRLPKLSFSDDNGYAASVEEGSAVAWQNGYVGLCKRIVMASIVPTTDEMGVWLSFACEEEQTASIELWHAPATPFGTIDKPVKKYTVSLGASGILGLSWVPIPLGNESNDTLGVFTLLRQQMLLTCELPRRNYPSETIHIEIAGATTLKVDGAVQTPPSDLRWYTTHKQVSETYLFVVYRCSAVSIYQPVAGTAGGSASRKLNLVQVATILPTKSISISGELSANLVPPFLRSIPMTMGTLPSTGEVYVALAQRDSLVVHLAPSFGLSNLHKLPQQSGKPQMISCLMSTSKGITVASDCAIHTYSFKVDHKELTTCCSAPVVALHELNGNNNNLAVCANAAGQVIQMRVRTNAVEVKSVLWMRRGEQPSNGTPAPLQLQRDFDGSLPLPQDGKKGGAARFSFHPFRWSQFGTLALAHFADGAWVLVPSSFERK